MKTITKQAIDPAAHERQKEWAERMNKLNNGITYKAVLVGDPASNKATVLDYIKIIRGSNE